MPLTSKNQNLRMITLKYFLIAFISILLASCDTIGDTSTNCEEGGNVLYEFESPDGDYIKIYESGKAYQIRNSECQFVIDYFDPMFFDQNFVLEDGKVFFKVDEVNLFEPIRTFEYNFEQDEDFSDVIFSDLAQKNEIFTAFTLQSPSAKTVSEYVALRNCILDQTCDFIDNRIDLASDPEDVANQVLKFSSVEPSDDMVTAKSSISTGLTFFEEGNDFWFEARFFLNGEYPTTIADFESPFFEGNPGPRIIFRGDKLAIENKFGDKFTYDQSNNSEVPFPKNEWVKVKVHFQYNTDDGIIQLWQNDELIVDAVGRNIPLANWVQTNIEIGISATSEATVLFVDDVRFSNEPF